MKAHSLFFLILCLPLIGMTQYATCWETCDNGYPPSPVAGSYYAISTTTDDVLWAGSMYSDSIIDPNDQFGIFLKPNDSYCPSELSAVIPNLSYPYDYAIGNICALSESYAFITIWKLNDPQDNYCGVYAHDENSPPWFQLPGVLQGASSFANNVYFWSFLKGMCHGDVRDGYFEVYTTQNGGISWTRVPQNNFFGNVLPGETGYTNVLTTAGDRTVIFGTSKGRILISNDWGFHWKIRSTPIVPTYGGVHDIAFVDSIHGIVCQQMPNDQVELFETSDGGVTWAQMFPAGQFYTHDICAVPGSVNTYVSTGSNPTDTSKQGMSYSFNGGHTWQRMPGMSGKRLGLTDWKNDSTAFVYSVGYNWYHFRCKLSLPIPDFYAQNPTVACGQKVYFSNISKNGLISSWTFPGGDPPSYSGSNLHPEVTYNTPGIYDVKLKVTNPFGSDSVVRIGYIYVGGVGTTILNNIKLNVYPNPVVTNFQLKSTEPMIRVELYDVIGCKMIDIPLDSKEILISVDKVRKGTYLLNVKYNQGTIQRRLVII